MTTLRDYILDCRCPNCGVLMQQPAPEKPGHWTDRVGFWLIAADIVCASVSLLVGEWGHATFFMAAATFVAVTDR